MFLIYGLGSFCSAMCAEVIIYPKYLFLLHGKNKELEKAYA